MKNLLLTTAFVLTGYFVFAQFTINNEASTMEVQGSSNVHDWTEQVETINGNCEAQFNANKLESISNLVITIPVESLKSYKSNKMDKNTYEALKSDEFPYIKFKMNSVSVEGDKVTCSGSLTIAGSTQEVQLSASHKLMYDGSSFSLDGAFDTKMTNFGIDPPTALMGTMKTKDEIKIIYHLVFDE